MSDTGQSGVLSHRLNATHVFLLTMSALSPAVSVFVFGGEVLKTAGTGAAIAFLIGILAALVWGMIYAELGAAHPHTGGEYAGVDASLGPAAGFADLVTWTISNAPYIALTATGLATYLQFLWPDIPVPPTAALALAVACAIAILNIRTNAVITGLFLSVELLALLVLAAVGLSHPVRPLSEAILQPRMMLAGSLSPVPIATLALAAVSGAYATVGGNQAINFGEEMIDPHRRMGRVVLASCLVGSVFIAGPMLTTILAAQDLPAILSSDAPLSTFLSLQSSPWLAASISGAVALAVFNALLAQVLQQSRFVYSLSRDGLWPAAANRWLTRIHPRWQSPWSSTVAMCGMAIPFCFLSGQTLLVLISSQIVFSLLLVSLSVIKGRRGLPSHSFRSPLFPLFPLLGLALSAIFAGSDLFDADAGRPSLLLYFGCLAAAAVYYVRVLRKRGWTVTDAAL